MSRISFVSFPAILAFTLVTAHAAASPERTPEPIASALLTAPSVPKMTPCAGLSRPDSPRTSEELARRVSEALLGKTKPTSKRPAPTAPESKPQPARKRAEWKCGQWVELWQGSGRGRTCEWREPAPQ